jgi:hypothetical protein
MLPLLNTYLPTTNISLDKIIYIIVGIIILYFIFKERKTVSHKTHNKYVIDTNEIVPTVSYFSYPVETIQHIFWSGGPHSTALLCYCLIVLGQPVQPIFITAIPGDLQRVKHIRQRLITQYPHLQSRLLPTWYVASVDKYRPITGLISKIKKEHPTIPEIQLQKWDAISRFCFADNINIFMAGNTAESALFTINQELFDKLFVEKIKNKLIFPQAHMSNDEIKQLALNSKHYYWDLVMKK